MLMLMLMLLLLLPSFLNSHPVLLQLKFFTHSPPLFPFKKHTHQAKGVTTAVCSYKGLLQRKGEHESTDEDATDAMLIFPLLLSLVLFLLLSFSLSQSDQFAARHGTVLLCPSIRDSFDSATDSTNCSWHQDQRARERWVICREKERDKVKMRPCDWITPV